MPRYANLQCKNELNLLGQARKKAGIAKVTVYEKLLIDHRKLKAFETGNEPPEIIKFVLDAAKLYGDPTLPERYCSELCPIGIRCRVPVETRDLAIAVLGLLKECNDVQAIRDRLIEIAEDGLIDEKERPDFERVMAELLDLQRRIESLKLWAETHLNQKERGKAA